jgi:thiaminase/transcriptional activator TenA
MPRQKLFENFTQGLRDSVADQWDREKAHPFVTGLGDGTLPLATFRYYMRQDYVFLIGFCQAVALAAGKAERLSDMAFFARLLDETLNTEMALHVSFCADFGISEDELLATAPSPTTKAYVDHLVTTAHAGTAQDAAAAILPCSWGYAEIGRTLSDLGPPESQPLYGRWIEMYADPEFAALAEWLRSYLDRSAEGMGEEGRRRIAEIFEISSRYEYMFWDAAYRLEEWAS